MLIMLQQYEKKYFYRLSLMRSLPLSLSAAYNILRIVEIHKHPGHCSYIGVSGMANLKIIITGIVFLLLSAFLFFDHGRMFGAIASQPGTTSYMQWFFAAAVIVSLLIALVGLKKPA